MFPVLVFGFYLLLVCDYMTSGAVTLLASAIPVTGLREQSQRFLLDTTPHHRKLTDYMRVECNSNVL